MKRSVRNAGAVTPAMVAATLAAQALGLPSEAQALAVVQDLAPAGAAAPDVAAPASQAAAPAGQSASGVRLRFNFKGQTYDQILDYFSR
ncbi:MAG: hypothetical protein ACKO3W_11705, partial [bacterium]